MSIEIFCSYAPEDDALLGELLEAFTPLVAAGVITPWHEGDLLPGDERRPETEARLQSAQLILLLVSSHFLASTACLQEMRIALARAQEHSATVVPIILRPVSWPIEQLAKLAVLPRDARPITSFDNRGEAFAKVAESIRALALRLARPPTLDSPGVRMLERPSPRVSDASSSGKMHSPSSGNGFPAKVRAAGLSRMSVAFIGVVVAGCLFLLYELFLAPSEERPSIDHGPHSGAVQPARPGPNPNAAPLRIGYSDWPGWVAWDVGVQKGWFRAAGVPVEFVWYEYSQTLEAFAAGRVDGCSMTNGDQLVTGANGTPSVAILLNDHSNGNDMVVARSGLDRVEQLRGRKVGVELGFVSHLLLLKALESAHLVEADVTLFNVPTDQTPQALEAGNVDAIVAWQPSSGRALRQVPGSKAIFTSADVPGLIYDVLAVNPESLRLRSAEWEAVVSIWFDIVDYIRKPENRQEVLAIMSRRVGVPPEAFALLLDGTFFLNAQDNVKRFGVGDTLASVVHSSRIVDAFNVANRVYKVSQNPETYLRRDLVDAVVQRRQRE